MQLTSFEFLLFFPVVTLIYFVVPARFRTLCLLAASLGFYVHLSPKSTLVLAYVTVLSYVLGLVFERRFSGEAKAGVAEGGKLPAGKLPLGVLSSGTFLAGTLVLVMLPLFISKYLGFVLDNAEVVLHKAGQGISLPHFSLFLPVGISYFTFQVAGYLIDVYRGKCRAEKNFVRYALFVSFFPKILSGPIERMDGFGEQLKKLETLKLWDAERIGSGMFLMLWGFFQKVVIADRLSIFVVEITDHYEMYGSTELILASLVYSIQLLADFAGYSDIALGAARIMGLELTVNFKGPLWARSMKEVWGSWHISLSSWLRDYIYIPLGGNRRGTVRKHLNTIIVFLVCGIWHGGGWNFIVWGLLIGLIIVLENVTAPYFRKLNTRLGTRIESFGYRVFQALRTFVEFSFVFTFFRLPSLGTTVSYLARALTRHNPWVLFDGSLYKLGIEEKYCHLMLWIVVIYMLTEYLKHDRNFTVDGWLMRQCVWFKWGMAVFIFSLVLILGAYGASYDAANFIYFGF